MPLPEPAPREHLHTRTLVFRGYDRADGLWDLEAELLDTKTHAIEMFERGALPAGEAIHDLAIRLTVDDAFTVRAVATSMDHTPFGECQASQPPVQALVGANLGPGWRSAVERAIGGTRSCTHLREMLVNLGTAAYQSIPAGQARRRGEPGQPRPVDGQPPRHLGGCRTWDVDGPVVARHYPEFAGWAPLRRQDRKG